MTPGLKRWVVVVLLVFSIGTPWTFLQSAAWLGMMVNFSRSASFMEALNRTFDGKHPCRLCCLVREGQEKERQQNPQQIQPLQKLELGLPPDLLLVFHPPVPWDHNEPESLRETFRERPPAPPPRA